MARKKKIVKDIIIFSRGLEEIIKRRYNTSAMFTGRQYITEHYIIEKVSRNWKFWVEDIYQDIWEATPRWTSPADVSTWYYKIYNNDNDILSLPCESMKGKIRKELVDLINRLSNTIPASEPPPVEEISKAEVKEENIENRFDLLDL